jgi:hypothetical protein
MPRSNRRRTIRSHSGRRSMAALVPIGNTQCSGMTKTGSRCKNPAAQAGHCRVHFEQNPKVLKKFGKAMGTAAKRTAAGVYSGTKYVARKGYKHGSIKKAQAAVVLANRRVKALQKCAKELDVGKGQLEGTREMRKAREEVAAAEANVREVREEVKHLNPRRRNPGKFFVIVDVSVPNGKWVGKKIYERRELDKADRKAAILRKKGRNIQVIDAEWFYPAQQVLRASGMIGNPRKRKTAIREYKSFEIRKLEDGKWVVWSDRQGIIGTSTLPDANSFAQAKKLVDCLLLNLELKSPRRKRNGKYNYPATFEGWLKENGLVAMPWYAPGYYIVTEGIWHPGSISARIFAVRDNVIPSNFGGNDNRVVLIDQLPDGRFEVGITGRIGYGNQPEDSHMVVMHKYYRDDTRTYKSFSKAMQKYVEKLLHGKPQPIKSLELNPRRRKRNPLRSMPLHLRTPNVGIRKNGRKFIVYIDMGEAYPLIYGAYDTAREADKAMNKVLKDLTPSGWKKLKTSTLLPIRKVNPRRRRNTRSQYVEFLLDTNKYDPFHKERFEDAVKDRHIALYGDWPDEDVYYLALGSVLGHGVGLWEGREPHHEKFHHEVMADERIRDAAMDLQYSAEARDNPRKRVGSYWGFRNKKFTRKDFHIDRRGGLYYLYVQLSPDLIELAGRYRLKKDAEKEAKRIRSGGSMLNPRR